MFKWIVRHLYFEMQHLFADDARKFAQEEIEKAIHPIKSDVSLLKRQVRCPWCKLETKESQQ